MRRISVGSLGKKLNLFKFFDFLAGGLEWTLRGPIALVGERGQTVSLLSVRWNIFPFRVIIYIDMLLTITFDFSEVI